MWLQLLLLSIYNYYYKEEVEMQDWNEGMVVKLKIWVGQVG